MIVISEQTKKLLKIVYLCKTDRFRISFNTLDPETSSGNGGAGNTVLVREYSVGQGSVDQTDFELMYIFVCIKSSYVPESLSL